MNTSLGWTLARGWALATFLFSGGCSLLGWDEYQYSPENACERLAQCCPGDRAAECKAAKEKGVEECTSLLATLERGQGCGGDAGQRSNGGHE